MALASPAIAAEVTDNFNRADNTDLGANWTPHTNSLRIVSNAIRETNDNVEEIERWAISHSR